MATIPSARFLNLETPAPNRAEPAKIWKARCYIREHSDEPISLTEVARFVQISPNHLSEKFKEVTGVKFVDYIARRRFAKACLLLQTGGLRISEIAFEVGFQSLSQFNRVFKKLSGRNPTEYRATECPTAALPLPQLNGPNGRKTLAEEMRSRSSAIARRLRYCEATDAHAVAPRQL
jgi:AraC-like DNA-binding protein